MRIVTSIAISCYLMLAMAFPSTLARNSYCSGNQYSAAKVNCDKFQFNKLTASGQCTDSNKKTQGQFHGVALGNGTTFYDISKLPNQTIDSHATKMAELITNVFENGNTKMGYAAVEKLGDCRGYTSGYVGFTTGTDDAYAVVKQYVSRNPKAPIGQYLPELKRLSQLLFGDPQRDDTTHLNGFDSAWKTAACSDPKFVQTQLDIGQSMYMKPAMKYAASVGIQSNLGKAIFYDTIVQHGWQYVEPFINLPRILQLTGPKEANESEQSYLTRFLTTRRQLVCCYPGGVWNDSADRMQELQSLVDQWSRNKDLTNSVELKIFGSTITGNEDIQTDSQRCRKKSLKKKKSNRKQ